MTENSPVRKRNVKRILLWVFLTLVFVPLFLLALSHAMGLFSSDLASVNDSDLRPQSTLSDDNNAYFDLLRANETNVSKEDAHRISELVMARSKKSEAWDAKSANDLVQRYAAPLSHFANAAKKPAFRYPLPVRSDGYKTYVVKHAEFIGAAVRWFKLSAIRAQLLADSGKTVEALDQVTDSIKVARQIQGPDSSLLFFTIGVAVGNGLLIQLGELLATPGLDGETLQKYHTFLTQMPPANKSTLNGVLKTEYRWFADFIPNFFSEYPKFLFSSYYMKPNQTKALMADLARSVIKKPEVSCPSLRMPQNATTAPLFDLNIVEAYFTQNAIGKSIYDGMAEFFASRLEVIREDQCANLFFLSATQVIVGLRKYKNDKGVLPDSLDELVPKYMTKLPIDPYSASGQPISYLKKDRLLKSSREDLLTLGIPSSL